MHRCFQYAVKYIYRLSQLIVRMFLSWFVVASVVLTNALLCCLALVRLFQVEVRSAASNTIQILMKCMPLFSIPHPLPNYSLCYKRHNFIKLNTLILSSLANMSCASIVATFYHSHILIWIRLSHVWGLRELGLFFSLYCPHSPPPPPCHISMLPPYRPFDVPALIWSLMESAVLLCLSVAES